MNNKDTIYRQAAIDALLYKGQSSRRYKLGETWELNLDEITEAIGSVPSAQLEHNPDDERKIADLHKMVNYLLSRLKSARKKGRWIFIGDGYKCSECRSVYSWWADSQTSNYCPNCGTEMSGEAG